MTSDWAKGHATVNNISLSRPRKTRRPTPLSHAANFRQMAERQRRTSAEKRCTRCLGLLWKGDGRCPCYNGGLFDKLWLVLQNMQEWRGREANRASKIAGIRAENDRRENLMALRRQELGYKAIICQHCGQVFASKHPSARFCHPAHQKAAKRAEKCPR